ncbi:MAG: asparagine synthase (glutamine-hydrolyzing) [Phycisphaerales bacterium]|nr:asparagine synthase (glutamine-hydrolyzing) [Phycisphaerales bacterium]
MCGFAGFVDRSERLADPRAVLRAMADAVKHRGPDGEGFFQDTARGVGIAHRRLAILDRTPAAAQPMTSPDGRWVLAYNGELWNHPELRAELCAAGSPVSESTGDTATLVALLAARGIEATLPALDGMFAFAALDRHEGMLWLARDRFGVKPCFWGWAEDRHGAPVFVFGSELRALTACPTFRNTVSPFALANALGMLCPQGADGVYDGVHALEPGCAVGLDLGTGLVVHRQWFDLRAAARAARAEGEWTDRASALTALGELVDAAVSRRLQSDVPVGAFLSGGIDSSLVASAIARAGGAPLRTFTLGFADQRYDERPRARTVAAALGAEHHESTIADVDLPELAEDAIAAFDVPFADSSALPTLALARAARGSVGVVLSGEGGDEFFAGYERHVRMHALARWNRRVPAFARARVAGALELIGGDTWDRTLAPVAPWLPAGLRRSQRGRLVHKLAGALRASDDESLWRALLSAWPDPSLAIRALPTDAWRAHGHRATQVSGLPPDEEGFTDELLLRDQTLYLPCDTLTKLDRATMECGLEAREPLLDARLFRFAWRIPHAWRTGTGGGKGLLRELAAARLPAPARVIASAPKQGFGVPLRSWLSGPLAGWADDLLSPTRLDPRGVLDGEVVRAALARARAGDESAAAQAWAACCVARWCEHAAIDSSRVRRA